MSYLSKKPQETINCQIIVAVDITLEENNKSRLLEEYKSSLQFLNYINDSKIENSLPIIEQKMSSVMGLLKDFNIKPYSAKDLDVIKRTMTFWKISLTPDGWIPSGIQSPTIIDIIHMKTGNKITEEKAKELLLQMKQESKLIDNITPEWIQRELAITVESDSKEVAIIRKFRQKYLLRMFMKWYAESTKSSFLLERLIPKLKCKEKQHTILCIDELNSKHLPTFNSCDTFKEFSLQSMIHEDVTLLLSYSYLHSPIQDEMHPIRKIESRNGKILLECNLPIKYRISHDNEHLVIQSMKNLHIKNGFLKKHIENFHDVLPKGNRPKWISVDHETDDNRLILQKHFMKYSGKDVFVTSARPLTNDYIEFFNEKQWTYVRPHEIIGSETSMLICIRLPILQDFRDIISRPRNDLIIITLEHDKDEDLLTK